MKLFQKKHTDVGPTPTESKQGIIYWKDASKQATLNVFPLNFDT